jgi:glycosyltransferase involved in cell wall biosynthesis
MPSYGGPAFSVSRLSSALAECGASVGLWAADQSARTTPVLPAESPVRRLIGTEVEALESFGRVDVLHDSGLWLRHNHQLAKLALQRGIPRVVSMRGMLEPWAISHKRWKKRPAWWLYQRRDLMRAACIHATAPSEAQNILALGLGVPVCMIPNGVDLPEMSSELACPRVETAGRKRKKIALFLGRIHPVKGLSMLIEAWGRVRPKGWVLQIAGPDESGYRSKLEREVAAAGLDAVVSFLGPIEGEQKRAIFLGADLFVLPTRSESFGMVIAESLAHGLPVLTTTGAPWPMLQKRGCGWWVDANIDGVTEGLRQATSQPREILQAMGARGRELVAVEFGWPRIAKEFMATYEELMSKRALSSDLN